MIENRLDIKTNGISTFGSILGEEPYQPEAPEGENAPVFYTDLNIHQIIKAILAGRYEYDLKPMFYSPLHTVEDIHYRQAVFKDLEDAQLFGHIKTFAGKMVMVRRYCDLIEKLDFQVHKQGWLLETVLVYCDAVSGLLSDLSSAHFASTGLIAFQEFLAAYVQSERFQSLQATAKEIKTSLAEIRYSVVIKGNWVRVRKYDGEVDYSSEVERVFEKFQQGAVKSYLVDLPIAAGMSYIEAQIVDCVARLYPDVFKALDQFALTYEDFIDSTIRKFDLEIQFYIAYLEYIRSIRSYGLKFCYPEVSSDQKEVFVREGFDLALATKSVKEKTPVVTNDFELKGIERIIVVSGPNQGGKTTFSRMFGQLHYFAALGCPVPGDSARLFLYDHLLTHFEKEEDIRDLRGKLQDDLVRIHKILEQATPNSLLIMNEIFTSTTLRDAISLSRKVMKKISELDALGVWVTFIDELSVYNEKTVSMVSMVVPENPAERTFKVIRKPADGLSYALSIVEKYHLTHEQIKERIQE